MAVYFPTTTPPVDIGQLEIDSEARGDVIVRDANGFTRVAIGNADEVLTSDGTDAAWAAAGGITSAVDSAFARVGGHGFTSPTNSTTAMHTWGGLMTAHTYVDSTSAVGRRESGQYFYNGTSTSSKNQAYWANHGSGHGWFDALPWVVAQVGLNESTDVNWCLAVADAPAKTLVGETNWTQAYVAVEYKTELGDSNIMISHDTAGGGAATRIDTGLAVSTMTGTLGSAGIVVKMTWASLTDVTVAIYDLFDLSTVLYSTNITTRLPVTGDFFHIACAIETQTTATKLQNTWRVEYGFNPGGNP